MAAVELYLDLHKSASVVSQPDVIRRDFRARCLIVSAPTHTQWIRRKLIRKLSIVLVSDVAFGLRRGEVV